MKSQALNNASIYILDLKLSYRLVEHGLNGHMAAKMLLLSKTKSNTGYTSPLIIRTGLLLNVNDSCEQKIPLSFY